MKTYDQMTDEERGALPFDDERRMHAIGTLRMDSESKAMLVRVDLNGLMPWLDRLRGDWTYKGRNGRERSARLERCIELIMRRAATRVGHAHGLLKAEPCTSDFSPTGRWFRCGGEVIHVDPAYNIAVIEFRVALDC
jgi:hypothetical protein